MLNSIFKNYASALRAICLFISASFLSLSAMAEAPKTTMIDDINGQPRYLLIETATMRMEIPVRDSVSSIQYSPDYQYLTFLKGDDQLWLLNTETGSLRLIELNKSKLANTSVNYELQWAQNNSGFVYRFNNQDVALYNIKRNRSYRVGEAFERTKSWIATTTKVSSAELARHIASTEPY